MNISVVIPLFNKEKYIKRALNSILEQTYPVSEIIVVDDGSTDKGSDVVRSMNVSKVKIIRQKNLGASTARNTGVMATKSSHIAFLDADDYWYGNHVSILIDLINKYPHCGAYSTLFEIESEYKNKKSFEKVFSRCISSNDFISTYSFNLRMLSCSTACVNRRAFYSAGCFPEGVSHGEDTILWFEIGARYDVAITKAITAVYCRDIEDRSIDQMVKKIPKSFDYLIARSRDVNLNFLNKKKILFILYRITFFTAISLRLRGNKDGFKLLMDFSKENRFYSLILIFLLLRVVPVLFLKNAELYLRKIKKLM